MIRYTKSTTPLREAVYHAGDILNNTIRTEFYSRIITALLLEHTRAACVIICRVISIWLHAITLHYIALHRVTPQCCTLLLIAPKTREWLLNYTRTTVSANYRQKKRNEEV